MSTHNIPPVNSDTVSEPEQIDRLLSDDRVGRSIALLRAALGHNAVLADAASAEYYANDVFWRLRLPAVVVVPRTEQQVADVMRIANAQGMTIVPRGAGLSYTMGALPPNDTSIVLDLSAMNKVLEVNAADGYVSVEAGCTWATLAKALEHTGMRTPYWGPMSGSAVTVGGAISNISAFYGSGVFGTVGESVIGVRVVLPSGELATTGSGGRHGTLPFTRYCGGPDLTGLFIGDNGAFGVKVAATLRLRARPKFLGYLSFGFSNMKDMAAVQVLMARTDKVCESFGIDRDKARQSVGFGAIARAEGWLDHYASTLHVMIEADSTAHLEDVRTELKRLSAPYADELSESVPKAVRDRPFGPIRGILGVEGERWVPTHALFPLSTAEHVVRKLKEHLSGFRDLTEQHGIQLSHFTMTIGPEYFFETAFYWKDEIPALHVATVGKEIAAPWIDRPADNAARAAVAKIRRATQEMYASLGGVSWQAGRDYPFERVITPEARALLASLKRAIDPNGLMNPGVLGADC